MLIGVSRKRRLLFAASVDNSGDDDPVFAFAIVEDVIAERQGAQVRIDFGSCGASLWRMSQNQQALRDFIDKIVRAFEASGICGNIVPDFVEVALRGSGDAQPLHRALDLARSAARRSRPRDFTRSASLWMVVAS